MKKNLLSLFLVTGLFVKLSAQCLTVSCPADVTANNDAGICGAVVNYSLPSMSSTCVAVSADTFNYTGSMQTYVVPAGVTTLTIETWGAQGGANWVNNNNFGGYSKADFSVTPGETLYIFVGQQPNSITGGYNGGGNGEGAGQGGGGGTDVRRGGTTLNDRIIVGGGGGGAGYWSALHVVGGVGGGMTGGDGYRDPSYASNPGGLGGTQSGPGANGTCVSTFNTAMAGGFGYGGAPSGCGCEGYGGGGGWYGGAGSGNCRGGGGGSGYILPIAANPTMIAGNRTGNGMAIISYNTTSTPTLTQTAGLPSGSTFPIGVTTNTFTASDAFGNSASCSFLVTISDNEAPVISNVPSAIVVNNDSGQCGANVTWPALTITDNCTASLTTTQSHNSGDFFPVGTTTVNYTTSDGVQSVSISFTVDVVDAEAPLITGIPSSISVNNDSGQCGAIVNWPALTITDNCSASPIVTQSHNSGDFFPVGITTVTYAASDGLQADTISFTVEVVDAEAPVISACPSDITMCPGIVVFTDPTVTDNCSATLAPSSGPSSGDTLTPGNYSVSYTAVDGAGNTSTCGFTITVNPLPVVTLSLPASTICLDDANLALTGGSPAGGSWSGTGVTGSSFDPTTAGTGTTTITYLFTDSNGCDASATDNIIVDACVGITENGIEIFRMFPNPASAYFTLITTENGTLEIMNVNGQVVKAEQITSNKQDIDLSAFANGTYVVRFISAEGKVSNGKLIIQK